MLIDIDCIHIIVMEQTFSPTLTKSLSSSVAAFGVQYL